MVYYILYGEMMNMDQEKIGKFIKEIRLREKLSQQKFAEKYGVTYQAVSKWETGKNIPDIAILKQMCREYHMNLDDFLETKVPNKKKIWIFYLLFICIFVIGCIFHYQKRESPFELKGLASTCDNFNLYGSIAYNNNKSSIYISNITYCGETNHDLYQTIECTLYESNGKQQTKIGKYDYKGETAITLDTFLQDLKLNVDNYEKTCKVYKENSLYLEIDAVEENGKIVTYKIPLKLEDDCNLK